MLYFFFWGVPSDSRVVANSILSLLGINCSGIIIACRDSIWIPFSITVFLWTAWLADVDAATRASRTCAVAAGTCRDRKAEGAWKGHDSLSIQHYTTISKISYIYSLRSDESFFFFRGKKIPIITSKKLLWWRTWMPRAFHVAHNCVPHSVCVRVCSFSLLEARGLYGCHHPDSNGSS